MDEGCEPDGGEEEFRNDFEDSPLQAESVKSWQATQEAWASASQRSQWNVTPEVESEQAWNKRHHIVWGNDGLHPNYRSYFDRWRDPKVPNAEGRILCESLIPSWQMRPDRPKTPKELPGADQKAEREKNWRSRHHLTFSNNDYYPNNRNYFDRARDFPVTQASRQIPQWSVHWDESQSEVKDRKAHAKERKRCIQEYRRPPSLEEFSVSAQERSLDQQNLALLWPKSWSEASEKSLSSDGRREWQKRHQVLWSNDLIPGKPRRLDVHKCMTKTPIGMRTYFDRVRDPGIYRTDAGENFRYDRNKIGPDWKLSGKPDPRDVQKKNLSNGIEFLLASPSNKQTTPAPTSLSRPCLTPLPDPDVALPREAGWQTRHMLVFTNDDLNPMSRSYFDRWREPAVLQEVESREEPKSKASPLMPTWRLTNGPEDKKAFLVSVRMTLNIDYQKLGADDKDKFKGKMQDILAKKAGVHQDAVSVILAPGGVKVDAEIYTSNASLAESFKKSLNTDIDYRQYSSKVLEAANSIPGVKAAITEELAIESLEVQIKVWHKGRFVDPSNDSQLSSEESREASWDGRHHIVWCNDFLLRAQDREEKKLNPNYRSYFDRFMKPKPDKGSKQREKLKETERLRPTWSLQDPRGCGEPGKLSRSSISDPGLQRRRDKWNGRHDTDF